MSYAEFNRVGSDSGNVRGMSVLFFGKKEVPQTLTHGVEKVDNVYVQRRSVRIRMKVSGILHGGLQERLIIIA